MGHHEGAICADNGSQPDAKFRPQSAGWRRGWTTIEPHCAPALAAGSVVSSFCFFPGNPFQGIPLVSQHLFAELVLRLLIYCLDLTVSVGWRLPGHESLCGWPVL